MTYGSADLFISENLVNCWLREGLPYIDVSPNQLDLVISDTLTLQVTYSWRGALKDVRLAGPVLLQGYKVSARTLIEIMVSFVRTQAECDNGRTPDWLENFEDSARHMELILSHPADITKDTTDFIASEQSLRLGHRFHPSPKSRIGFSREDIYRYSPEWGGKFPLRYIEVPREQLAIRGDEAFLQSFQADISEALGERTDDIIFPMHPWEARHAGERLTAAIRENGWRDLGELGPEFYPTSSVRTLYWRESGVFLKTSLDVRITNCFRRNQRNELEAIAILNPLIDQALIKSDRFRVLHEPVSLDLKNFEDLHLGVIFREGLKPEFDQGLTPLVAASLFGDRDFSLKRMEAILRGQSVVNWFAKYCECLVPPIMEAFWGRGLMCEPHLQNTLVALEDSSPRRVILRDIDNMKLVHGHPFIQNVMPMQELNDLFFDRELGWKRLIYCLIVNHLAEAISTLSLLAPKDSTNLEHDLWQILASALKNAEIPADRKAEILGSGRLWSKMNLFTRVTRTNDLKAPFAPLENPFSRVP